MQKNVSRSNRLTHMGKDCTLREYDIGSLTLAQVSVVDFTARTCDLHITCRQLYSTVALGSHHI